jgi:hypothetical protein
LYEAGLGRLLGMSRDGLAAAGAVLEGAGTFLSRGEGLPFQAQLQHLLRENVANLDHQVFQFRELSAPPGTAGAPDAVGKVFGNALHVMADFFYLGDPFLVSCHPWLLLRVKAKTQSNLPRESTTSLSCLANHVPHPRLPNPSR